MCFSFGFLQLFADSCFCMKNGGKKECSRCVCVQCSKWLSNAKMSLGKHLHINTTVISARHKKRRSFSSEGWVGGCGCLRGCAEAGW